MKCGRSHCHQPATAGRDDGLCWRHRGDASQSVRRIAERAARLLKPPIGRPLSHSLAACSTCSRPVRFDKLRTGVCGLCRQAARTAKHRAQQVEKERRLCSVSRCLRGREVGTTCLEHAPRFDRVRPARTLRAEDFTTRTRDPREGV